MEGGQMHTPTHTHKCSDTHTTKIHNGRAGFTLHSFFACCQASGVTQSPTHTHTSNFTPTPTPTPTHLQLHLHTQQGVDILTPSCARMKSSDKLHDNPKTVIDIKRNIYHTHTPTHTHLQILCIAISNGQTYNGKHIHERDAV